MDWQEIIDKYNIKNPNNRDGNIHFDSLRKAQQTIFGGGFVYEYLKNKNSSNVDIAPNTYLDELRQEKIEIQKERYKLQATKLEMQRNLRQDSRFELFYENISNAINRLEKPKFIRNIIVENNKKYVMGLGDIHYGATFTSLNNKYSREECKNRFQLLLNMTIDYVGKNNITELDILNVADTIQGILRLTDLQINDIPVVECVVEISHIIAEFLNQLSAYCNINYYHVCNANHSQTRNLGSKASELATEDMEKIIANYIKDLLMNNESINVIFDTSKEYLDFKIFDFDCFAEHGHRINNIKTHLKDKSLLNRKMYSYGFVGHSHSSQEIIVGEEENNNIELFVIPSFVGSDMYSDSLQVGSKAMVKIFKFDEVYGHVGSKSFILN